MSCKRGGREALMGEQGRYDGSNLRADTFSGRDTVIGVNNIGGRCMRGFY